MKNYLSYAEMYVKFMQAYEQGLEKTWTVENCQSGPNEILGHLFHFYISFHDIVCTTKVIMNQLDK